MGREFWKAWAREVYDRIKERGLDDQEAKIALPALIHTAETGLEPYYTLKAYVVRILGER